VQVVARGYFGLTTRGFDNVPTTGAYIVAPIHRSNLDTPLIGAITRRRLRYMGKESMWKKRFGAWFLTAAGGFPVERGTADRAAIRACLEVLERGEPLVVFPEGTRQSGTTICEMYDGPAYLACRAQVPLLPIGIGGTEAAMPKGHKFPKRTRLSLVVGAPIPPPPPEPGKDRVSRKAIRQLTEQLGEEIQRLFDEARALVGDAGS
jgi:1-acyl-sn-glycerol-3-phosphate acyltransferase